MSGVEVVLGLVLGALPLAISACEHARDVAGKCGYLADIETKYKKVLGDIKDEQVIFRLQLERLLRPLVKGDVLEEGDLEKLIADVHDPLWADDDVNTAIKTRLGRTYEGFVRVLDETQKDTLKLLKSLGFGKAKVQERIFGDKVDEPKAALVTRKLTQTVSGQLDSQHGCSDIARQENCRRAFINFNLEFEAQRLKFGLVKPRSDEVTRSIRENNEKLGKFLDLSGSVADLQDAPVRSLSRFVTKSLLQYWKHAERLYTLLQNAWGCSCQDRHQAHLWLRHRTSPNFELRLLLLFAGSVGDMSATNPAGSWHQKSLKIEPLKESRTTLVVSPPVNVPAVPLTAAIAPAQARRKAWGLETFKLEVKSRLPIHHARAVTTSPERPSLEPAPMVSFASANVPAIPAATYPAAELTETTQLCSSMSACAQQEIHLGCLHDHELERLYSVFTETEPDMAGAEVTLAELLQSTYRPKLGRRNRYSLALAIASTHLQLQSTPWARLQWTAANIYFPSDASQRVLVDRPFISADFKQQVLTHQRPANGSDRAFTCLGIMLLELAFGKLLADIELWDELGFDVAKKGDAVFRLMVARHWADFVEEKEGPEMSAAIMWCLNESPTTLEGQQWRRDLADRVVLPIQNCCYYLSRRVGP